MSGNESVGHGNRADASQPGDAPAQGVRVPSKERLLHLLAEAAELEHNLLCSYLFAMFSLKQDTAEGLSTEELEAVERWRGQLLGVCIEEMTHLAQVANITLSMGARPHLNRPNIPVSPGYHPAAVSVELTRLDLDTLNHFCFLERPDGSEIPDGMSFGDSDAYVRRLHHGDLMPAAPNYETIGEFYGVLKSELTAYVQRFGEASLFGGPRDVQLRPDELHTDALRVISGLADALEAVDEIVREGEGSPAESATSHFAMFLAMRDEFQALVAARADFAASRPVGRNPVMHAPVCEGRTHVTEPAASRVLDAANAAYGLMLRCLAQCFETPWHEVAVRAWLVRGCVSCMKVVSLLGKSLTRLDASAGSPSKAGLSFAMLRSMQGWQRQEDATTALNERAGELHDACLILDVLPQVAKDAAATLAAWMDDGPPHR